MTDYVVRKGGYFYRPNAAGYTASVFEAGRWSKEEADKYAAGCEGVTIHRADEFDAPEAESDATYEAITRSIRHHLNGLIFQPTGKDPKNTGFNYAEVPEWQLRRWLTKLEKPAREWRCFHCAEVFTTEEDAGQHFGVDQTATCACVLKEERPLIMLIREQEAELRQYRAEESASYRGFYELGASHAVALRREEEKGYARGLRDARAEPVSDEEIQAGVDAMIEALDKPIPPGDPHYQWTVARAVLRSSRRIPLADARVAGLKAIGVD